MFGMYSTCKLCGAAMADSLHHAAWHAVEGHNMSEERIAEIENVRQIMWDKYVVAQEPHS